LKWLADFPWKLEFHHRNYDLKYCSSAGEFSRWFPNNLKGFCLLLINISQINENTLLIAQIAVKIVTFLVKTAHIKCARDSGNVRGHLSLVHDRSCEDENENWSRENMNSKVDASSAKIYSFIQQFFGDPCIYRKCLKSKTELKLRNSQNFFSCVLNILEQCH